MGWRVRWSLDYKLSGPSASKNNDSSPPCLTSFTPPWRFSCRWWRQLSHREVRPPPQNHPPLEHHGNCCHCIKTAMPTPLNFEDDTWFSSKMCYNLEVFLKITSKFRPFNFNCLGCNFVFGDCCEWECCLSQSCGDPGDPRQNYIICSYSIPLTTTTAPVVFGGLN